MPKCDEQTWEYIVRGYIARISLKIAWNSCSYLDLPATDERIDLGAEPLVFVA